MSARQAVCTAGCCILPICDSHYTFGCPLHEMHCLETRSYDMAAAIAQAAAESRHRSRYSGVDVHAIILSLRCRSCLCSASSSCEVVQQRQTIQSVRAIDGVTNRHDVQLQHQLLDLISPFCQRPLM